MAALVAATNLQALPDDSKQQIEIDAASSKGGLEEGLMVLAGTPEHLAKITQGSLMITGTEIRIYLDHGQFQSATATGNPARFQQQPAPDKELTKANGKEIKIDNKTRLVTITSNAEIMQNGSVTTGSRIEYNVDTKQVNADQVHMVIPPSKDKK